jgi:hypothetical protein
MKTMKLGDVLTAEELKGAQDLFLEADSTGQSPAHHIAEKIIKPNIERINRATGQENDPGYLGYAIEFAFRSERPQLQSEGHFDAEGFDCEDPTVCE